MFYFKLKFNVLFSDTFNTFLSAETICFNFYVSFNNI